MYDDLNGVVFSFKSYWWMEYSYSDEQIVKLLTGDYNGDGRDDVAAFCDYYDSNSRIHVWLSTGTSFTYQGDNGWWKANDYAAVNSDTRIVSGDINGDGKADIAAIHDYSAVSSTLEIRIHVWLSTGSSFQNPNYNGWSTHHSYYANAINGRVVMGDFSGDGRLDIAAMYDYGNDSTRIHVWLLTQSLGYSYQGDNGWWSSSNFPLVGHTCTGNTHPYVDGVCTTCGHIHDKHIVDANGYCKICSKYIGVSETISPTDYGYPEEYNFNEIEQTITLSSGTQVTTNRLRTGYISNSYLTLSAKRHNAGTAYLEYHFDEYLSSIDYQLALWSDSESLILNSSIRLEILNETTGTWITIETFDARYMSQAKEFLWDYHAEFPYAVKSFRFIIETNQVQNENNRGRMVIGDIEAYYF